VDDRDLVGQIMLLQRGQRQFHVPRIIFDQQDFLMLNISVFIQTSTDCLGMEK
jgi:hypothetical protein